MPSDGTSARGSSDVAPNGTASLTHQTAIQSAIAPIRCALGGAPATGTSTATRKRVGPSSRPIF